MDLSSVERRPLGPAARALAWIAGADSGELEKCPRRDVGNVLCVAWLLVAVWAWQSIAFTLVGHMMLAREGEFNLLVMLGAIGIASIVLLMDSYVIVRSSWYVQGLKELKRGGLEVPGTVSARISSAFFLMIRILLTLVLAQLTAIFFSLLIYKKDIATELEADHQRRNAPLLARLTSTTDEGVESARKYVEALRAQLGASVGEEERLRRMAVDPTSDDPQVKLLLERIASLTAAKMETSRALQKEQDFAANEKGGLRVAPGNSGLGGPGRVYKAALERIANLQRTLDRLDRDLSIAESKLSDLRTSKSGVAGQRKDAATARLGDAATGRQDLAARLAAAEAALAELTASRQRVLRNAIESDPNYKSRDTGFLASWKALLKLASDPWVALVIFLIDAAAFFLELSAVISKTTTFVPATYATLIAQDDLLRAHREAHRLAASIRALHEEREEKPDETPTPKTAADGQEAEAEATAQGSETAERPKGQRRPRTRPRGPTFRPDLSGVGEGDDASGSKDSADQQAHQHKGQEGRGEENRAHA